MADPPGPPRPRPKLGVASTPLKGCAKRIKNLREAHKNLREARLNTAAAVDG